MSNEIKLSIIVPYHNEDDSIIFPLFNSLNNQIDINFDDIEIIVSNNCEIPVPPKSLFDGTFPNIQNRIKYIISPIKNISGASRQFGVDKSKGKYLMFCDDDDFLPSTDILNYFINLAEIEPDVDVFRCWESIQQKDSSVQKVFDRYNVLIHGKLFSATFIKKNNISFSGTLDVAEDNYFCSYLFAYNPKILDCDKITYFFNYNSNSVSRKHKYFSLACQKNICIGIVNMMDKIMSDKNAPHEYAFRYLLTKLCQLESELVPNLALYAIANVVFKYDPKFKWIEGKYITTDGHDITAWVISTTKKALLTVSKESSKHND